MGSTFDDDGCKRKKRLNRFQLYSSFHNLTSFNHLPLSLSGIRTPFLFPLFPLLALALRGGGFRIYSWARLSKAFRVFYLLASRWVIDYNKENIKTMIPFQKSIFLKHSWFDCNVYTFESKGCFLSLFFYYWVSKSKSIFFSYFNYYTIILLLYSFTQLRTVLYPRTVRWFDRRLE